jgi:hypothetical protein
LGHALFKSTPETFPVLFIAGDVFDSSHLQPTSPSYDPPLSSAPILSSLISLNPLHGHVAVIYVSSFFHLFDEEKQLQLARSLASLISPLPGSLIFGSHVALPVKGMRTSMNVKRSMFCHSPDSWQEMWNDQVFKKGMVDVKAKLVCFEDDQGRSTDILVWSITRV